MKRPPRLTRQPPSSKGFTLIEVLVALLIAAIGMLGIAALVLFSMRASFESGLQSYAAVLAVDVHETAWLMSHEATLTSCQQIQDARIDAETALPLFAPNLNIPGLTASVEGTYPLCVFRVVWGADPDPNANPDDSLFGVVGRMAGFGGEFIHQFTIPSVN